MTEKTIRTKLVEEAIKNLKECDFDIAIHGPRNDLRQVSVNVSFENKSIVKAVGLYNRTISIEISDDFRKELGYKYHNVNGFSFAKNIDIANDFVEKNEDIFEKKYIDLELNKLLFKTVEEQFHLLLTSAGFIRKDETRNKIVNSLIEEKNIFNSLSENLAA